MNKLNVAGFKLHNSDLTNNRLVSLLSKTKKPILVSTAGSTLFEIEEAIQVLKKNSKEIVLMHGYQGYPTQINDLNFKRIPELKSRFDLPVGIMDHVSGDSKLALIAPLLGISLGATVVEKHVTLDRSKKGIDYFSSLNPNEFKKLVTLIRFTQKSLGSSLFSHSKNEKIYRQKHKKFLISRKQIKKGEKLNEKMFDLKRSKLKGKSVSSLEIKGKVASRNIRKGQILTASFVHSKIPKTSAVIACRVDSDRLYAKPMQPIGKNPILYYLIEQIKKSLIIEDIVLAISNNPGNEIFVDFAKKQNIKFIVGDEIDVLGRLIEGANHVNADIVFRCTSENPIIFWEKIDELITKHVDGKYDYSYIEDLPLGSCFEVINKSTLEKSHKLGSRRHRSELATLYINENKSKFRVFKFIPETSVRRPDLRLTVDTPEDLVVTKILYKKLYRKGIPILLEDAIKFLDDNPQTRSINSGVKVEFIRYDTKELLK